MMSCFKVTLNRLTSIVMDEEDEEPIDTFQNLSLESKLKHTEMELHELKQSFAMYKQMIQTTFMSNTETPVMEKKEESDDYFTGYGYNDIHAQMLKDTVRTEGYRDFIYQNKNIFEGKVGFS
jgi:protein arginine N-methyltransferase 3